MAMLETMGVESCRCRRRRRWHGRDDRHGRLKRTARFIAATTFGSTATAEASIAQVRRIHDRVMGTLPDGTPYTANDPALLTCVHVAEVDSFLRAYLRYRDPRMSVADQERYVAETAMVAEALGATDVPRSRAEIEAYFARIRPELRADHRTREVAAALLAPGDDKATTSAMNLAVAAAIDLLPTSAHPMDEVRAAVSVIGALETAGGGNVLDAVGTAG